MNSTFSRIAPALAALLAAGAAAAAPLLNHDTVTGPLPAGRFPVACSNVAQDTSRIAPGLSASDYWEGRGHYITEILASPDAALTYPAAVPNDSRIYPSNAGASVPFVAIVCYPTSRANADPDYVLPGSGDKIPHMQPAGAAPKIISLAEYFAAFGTHVDPAPPPTLLARLPLIVFSHGLTGSPISEGYVRVLEELAAQGYMVAAPFHGDPRFSRVRVQDLSDVLYLIRDLDHVVEMQLMRPLSLKVMTDVLLADPRYAAGIDGERIAGFGASLGGEAMALLTGAKLTTSWDFACDDPVRDPRIKVAVGYVPYAGQTFMPAFCSGQTSANVNRPYLAISGSADITAPLPMALEAVQHFKSSRYLVELVGGQHELRPEDAPAVLTWTITFFDAYLGVPFDPGAWSRFIHMAGVSSPGGLDQKLLHDIHLPLPSTIGQTPALEFHNKRLDHYFVAVGDEAQGVLNGAAGPDWEPTGQSFNAWMSPNAADGAVPVCRFYGKPAGGPDSHFYTATASECDLVKRLAGWYYEGTGFFIRPVSADGTCPPGYFGVVRAYNNGFPTRESNHRFSTSDSTMRDMAGKGWTVEGVVMCARP